MLCEQYEQVVYLLFPDGRNHLTLVGERLLGRERRGPALVGLPQT
jgi:hypothetical protein